MKTISFFALSVLLFLVACDKDNDKDISLNKAFELDYRITKDFDEGDFSITFENLIEDSRCPTDAVCFWEGRAIVEIKVQVNESISMYTMATINPLNGDSLLTFQHDNYKVKLIDVNPYPAMESGTDNTEDYSVTLEITEDE